MSCSFTSFNIRRVFFLTCRRKQVLYRTRVPCEFELCGSGPCICLNELANVYILDERRDGRFRLCVRLIYQAHHCTRDTYSVSVSIKSLLTTRASWLVWSSKDRIESYRIAVSRDLSLCAYKVWRETYSASIRGSKAYGIASFHLRICPISVMSKVKETLCL